MAASDGSCQQLGAMPTTGLEIPSPHMLELSLRFKRSSLEYIAREEKEAPRSSAENKASTVSHSYFIATSKEGTRQKILERLRAENDIQTFLKIRTRRLKQEFHIQTAERLTWTNMDRYLESVLYMGTMPSGQCSETFISTLSILVSARSYSCLYVVVRVVGLANIPHIGP